MAVWLMHTYAAYRLGILKTGEGQAENAFLLGNIAPDWVNFVPEGRTRYRKRSHYAGKEVGSLCLSDYVKERYDAVAGASQKMRAFYEGYGFHLIFDYFWSQAFYLRYKDELATKELYLYECLCWDQKLMDYYPGANACNTLLAQADKRLPFDISVPSDFILPGSLYTLCKQAVLFAKKERPVRPPRLFTEEAVEEVILGSISLFFDTFGAPDY